MALTMTRTRTQTALSKFASMVANVHGEMAFLKQLSAPDPDLTTEQLAAVEARLSVLEEKRQALYLTLQQFNPELDPAEIGTSEDWLRPYGRRGRKSAKTKYVNMLKCAP
jgi:hypothetical protein